MNNTTSKSVTRKKVIKVPEGKIWDYIDGKFREDTPEEYVRQTIERRLVLEYGYKRQQIRVEYTLSVGSKKPRADIAVFHIDSHAFTQEQVWLVVECKNEKIDPRDKKDGVGQLKSYMSVCPNCEWGMWTNGKHREVWRKIQCDGAYIFEEYNDIPSANGSAEEADRPTRNRLKRSYDDNLLMTFKTCHNHIYVTDGLQKQPAFFEFLKLIFCKTFDEHNIGHPLQFYTTSKERSNPDGQLTVKNRIAKLFENVKRQFPQIFDANDEIRLKPRSVAWVVSELQSYSLLDTHIDVKGKAYETIVGANLRGDRGEFFTPRNIMRMAVQMVNPSPDETICDPSCGTGGFLVMALNHVSDLVEQAAEQDFVKPRQQWTEDETAKVKSRIQTIAASHFYGFDLNPDLVKVTKMNMFMNNDGNGNIYDNNSLLPPHEWESDLKRRLEEALHLPKRSIRNARSLGLFDVIVTNPPFGSKNPIRDSHILEQFDIGHLWHEDETAPFLSRWTRSASLRGDAPPEQLFLERCLQFLKPGGRMAIVVPDSILGNPGLGYIREWLLEHTRIVASIDLHADTFQPHNGTQTSILIVQKKTDDDTTAEQRLGAIKPYNIFMAMVEKVGHDKRGNTVFKRDDDGNEIWEPEHPNVFEMGQDEEGNSTAYTTASKTRIIDDQSRDVPSVFARWKHEEGIAW